MSRSGIYDLKYGFIPDDDCPQDPPKPTNADRIRSMSDNELVDILNFDFCPWCDSHCREKEACCRDCIAAWLAKEVKEND